MCDGTCSLAHVTECGHTSMQGMVAGGAPILQRVTACMQAAFWCMH
jgi:hypothetical protein